MTDSFRWLMYIEIIRHILIRNMMSIERASQLSYVQDTVCQIRILRIVIISLKIEEAHIQTNCGSLQYIVRVSKFRNIQMMQWYVTFNDLCQYFLSFVWSQETSDITFLLSFLVLFLFIFNSIFIQCLHFFRIKKLFPWYKGHVKIKFIF